MKKLLLILALILLATQVVAQVYVHGYYRKNGTYVAPHTRTNPDGIKWNNKNYRF